MNPIFIAVLAIVLAVAAIFLAVRFGKHFIRFFAIIMFFLIVGMIIYAVVIVDDGVTFKNGMTYDSNLMLLVDEGEIISAIVLKPVDKKSGVDVYNQVFAQETGKEVTPNALKESLPFKVLNDEALVNYNRNYVSDNYDSLLSSFHRILIFNSSLFSNVNDKSIFIGQFSLSISEALMIIKSEDASNTLISYLAGREGMSTRDVEVLLEPYLSMDIRSLLFGLITMEMVDLEERDMVQIFDLIENNHLIIKPHSPIMGFFDDMDTDVVDVFFNRIEGEE